MCLRSFKPVVDVFCDVVDGVWLNNKPRCRSIGFIVHISLHFLALVYLCAIDKINLIDFLLVTISNEENELIIFVYFHFPSVYKHVEMLSKTSLV